MFLFSPVYPFSLEFHTGLRSIPSSSLPSRHLLPAHVACRSAPTNRPVAGGPGETDSRLEALDFSARDDLPQSMCFLLLGLFLDKGQRSTGYTERGTGVGSGTSQ